MGLTSGFISFVSINKITIIYYFVNHIALLFTIFVTLIKNTARRKFGGRCSFLLLFFLFLLFVLFLFCGFLRERRTLGSSAFGHVVLRSRCLFPLGCNFCKLRKAHRL